MPELLAPARDREAFLAALAAGADAVYCGVAGGLNARRKAAGIGEEELPALCRLARDHGVRVYVTTNIVVKQVELAGAVEAAGRYLAAGVDALIIQDLGFLAEVRRAWPGAEIHVSTQANVHDARGVALCRELGASRVTLSRELPLGEILTIASAERREAAARGVVPCELEVFAHGAICPSYSGLCMLSSFLREGRSPNRGLCAQPCRLPFDLVDERGARLQAAERERPLCTHDNCALPDVGALVASGVTSLKLEGRMKPAAYVHAVTSAYRRALDALRETRGDAVAPGPAAPGLTSRHLLKRSFNRGLTDAYLRGRSGNELMSYERSGNRGELVGAVVGFEPEPGFVPRDGQQVRGEALVRLTASVGRGDSVELRHPAEPTRFLVAEVPRDAVAGETLRIRVPRPMPVAAEARLTRSVALEEASARAVAAMEEELAGLEAGRRTSEVARGGLPGASGAPGATASRSMPAARLLVGPPTPPPAARPSCSPTPELCALAGRVEDAGALRAAGATRVYLDVIDIEPTEASVGRARAEGLVPVLGEVCREPDHALLDPWVAEGLPVAVANLSEVALARGRVALAEVTSDVPVHNASTLALLARLGARGAWLSPELSLTEALELAAQNRALPRPLRLGATVYGRPRLMTCEHCVLQVAYGCDRNHAACPHRARPHWLVNIDGRRLPVSTDARGRSRVYLDEPVDLGGYACELVRAGVSRLLVDARNVSLEDAARALRATRAALLGEGGLPGEVPCEAGRACHDGLARAGVR